MGRKNILFTALTLVELLVVISILMILAAFALWYFRSQIFKGNDAKRKGDIHIIQVAIEEYEKDYDCYPPPSVVVCNPGTGLAPYLNKIPCDPVTKASYYYDYDDNTTCPHWYRIYAKLDNTSDPDIKKVGCENGCGLESAFNYAAGSPNAPAAAGGEPGQTFLYGCKNLTCVPLSWDPSRPGAECDPNYHQSDCLGDCTEPVNECTPWRGQ